MFVQTVAIVDAANPVEGVVNTGSRAHSCQWCYKQYVLKNKLLRHQRVHHYDLLPAFLQEPQPSKKLGHKTKKTTDPSKSGSTGSSHGIEPHAQTVNLQFTGTFSTHTLFVVMTAVFCTVSLPGRYCLQVQTGVLT